jgi:hypothetical protein
LRTIHRRYSDRADFLLIYIREAHPSDHRCLETGSGHEVCVPTARSALERAAAAREMRRRLEIDFPVLIDSMDDSAAEAYSAFPDRIYLVDQDGRVAHKGGRGPHGFDPGALEQALLLALVDEDAKPDGPFQKLLGARGASIEAGLQADRAAGALEARKR